MKKLILDLRSQLVELSNNNDFESLGRLLPAFKILIKEGYALGIVDINDRYFLEIDGIDLIGLDNSLLSS